MIKTKGILFELINIRIAKKMHDKHAETPSQMMRERAIARAQFSPTNTTQPFAAESALAGDADITALGDSELSADEWTIAREMLREREVAGAKAGSNSNNIAAAGLGLVDRASSSSARTADEHGEMRAGLPGVGSFVVVVSNEAGGTSERVFEALVGITDEDLRKNTHMMRKTRVRATPYHWDQGERICRTLGQV